MITIPSAYKNFGVGEENIDLLQLNTSTVLGDFIGTFNCDLYTNKGKIRVSPRGMFNTSTNDVPIAIRAFTKSSTAVWAIVAGNFVYFNASLNPSSTFTKDATSGSPITCSSQYSDAEIFNGYLYVTANEDKVYKFSSTAWTNFAPGFTAATPHMLCVFNNRMYSSDDFIKIISWDTADSVVTSGQNTITTTTANNSFQSFITFLRVAQNRIFIGTMNNNGGHGYVYVWDGVSPTTFDKQIELKSTGALSCVVWNDIPYIMDSRGFLLKYNGANFEEIARLPLYNKRLLSDSNDPNNTRWIHPNGMTISWDRINILIDNAVDSGIEPYCPSGIWEYDPSVGLYHKTSCSNTPVATTTITDYGQVYIAKVGALIDANIYSDHSAYAGTLLWGAGYYTDSSGTTITGVFTNDSTNTTQKWGYIISPETYSSNVESLWGMIYAQYGKLLDSADEIVIKYRSVIDIPTESNITWVNTTSFTLGSATTYVVGDEVEIIQAVGSGKSAHISALSADKKTVTLDDPFTGVGTGTAKARFTKWIKLGKITSTTTLKNQFSKFSFPIGNNDTKIQIKVCMQFLGNDEFERVQIVEKSEVAAT